MANRKLYSWVVRGKQRRAVIKALSKVMIPSLIHEKSKQYNEKVSQNNVCDVLKAFLMQGLVVCLNNEAKTGRLYKLTQYGEEIREELMQE